MRAGSSATAVTADGELAGHCAIFRSDSGSQSAEIGQAVVKPEFRGQGCLLGLTEFLINEAKSRGLIGLYVHAVTSHAFSQRVATRLGFTACAILLGHAPASITFRGIKEELAQRETFLLQYKYLEKPGPLKLYAPSKHKDFIAKIYGNLGVSPQFEALGFFFAGILPGASVGEALVLQYLNNVAIDYDSIELHTEASREILAYIKRQDPNCG
ncbi:MAG: GNAT family N-acetyltransferase [Pseudomonadota bacterium]